MEPLQGPWQGQGAFPCSGEGCCYWKMYWFNERKNPNSWAQHHKLLSPNFPVQEEEWESVQRICLLGTKKVLPIKTKGGMGNPCSPSTLNLSGRPLPHPFGLLIDYLKWMAGNHGRGWTEGVGVHSTTVFCSKSWHRTIASYTDFLRNNKLWFKSPSAEVLNQQRCWLKGRKIGNQEWRREYQS